MNFGTWFGRMATDGMQVPIESHLSSFSTYTISCTLYRAFTVINHISSASCGPPCAFSHELEHSRNRNRECSKVAGLTLAIVISHYRQRHGWTTLASAWERGWTTLASAWERGWTLASAWERGWTTCSLASSKIPILHAEWGLAT